MAQKLSANAIKQLSVLSEAKRKWNRVHALAEQAASNADTREMFLRQCQRAARDVSQVFDGSGFRNLADMAAQLELVVRRRGSYQARLGAIREIVGTVFTGIDRAEQNIVAADEKASREGGGPFADA